MITSDINKKIAEALKAKEEIRLSTLRLLSSELNYEFIAKQHELSEEEELAVVRHEVKKRKEAVEALRQAQGKLTSSGTNMDDRIAREQKEMEILQEYLPPEMPDEELTRLVDEVVKETGAVSISEMGKVIGAVMKKVAGRADGKKVANLVRMRLAQSPANS